LRHPTKPQGSFYILLQQSINPKLQEECPMEFFESAVDTMQTLVIALGAGLGVWGIINLLEGYGSDNPGAKSQGKLA